MPALALLLMAGTCWVVGSMVSAWLVPPYLLLMALILLPSPGRRRDAGAGGEAGSTPAPCPVAPDEGDADPAPPESPAPAGPVGGTPDQADAPGPTKPRRGKGRSRKAKLTPEVAEATWIMVAPGKFVRVEAPTSATSAGPHDLAGTPVEGPPSPPMSADDEAATPESLDAPGPEGTPPGEPAAPMAEAPDGPRVLVAPPAEDVSGAVDDRVDRPEVAPAPGVAPGASAAAGADPGDEPGRIEGDFPAVDGTLPQAGADPRWPDPVATEADPGAQDHDRDRADRDREGSEIGDAFEASSTRDPEPTADPGRSAVPPEDQEEDGDAWRRGDEGFDPTETAVDETVLDDAEPAPAHASAIAPDAPRPDDPPASAAFPEGVPAGPPWRIDRLATIRRPRAGPDARALGRESPPRRPARSHGPARRPLDPRRLTRRGAERPRQITRTFPPRSPPSGTVGRRGRDFRSKISNYKLFSV